MQTAPPTPIGLPIAGTPQGDAEAGSPAPAAPFVDAVDPTPATPPAAHHVARTSGDVALRPRPGVLALEAAHAERSQDLALEVCRQMDARGVHALAVTSAERQEGRTTLVCNLAVAFARIAEDLRIALVDLDLRHPAVATALGVNQGCGIETVLAGRAALEAACVPINSPRFDVFPAFSPQRASHDLLSQPGFADAMAQLRERYDIVLIDTPPTTVPDPVLVAAQGIHFLTVARVGRTRARSFARMLRVLPPDQVIGEALTEERVARGSGALGFDDYRAFGASGKE